MTLYVLAKYLHVVGALAMFVALGLDWARLAQLRRAETPEQVREWARVTDWLRWLGPFSLAAILLPGIYMMATVWRDQAPWIGIAFGALVMIAVLAVSGERRTAAAVQAGLAEQGRLSRGTRSRLRAPFPWISVQARAALLLAVVYLMTAKTDRESGLWAIALAALAAGAAAVLGRRGRAEVTQ